MTLNTSARLTIFEGPDGSGKTTAAKVFASATGAKYVHFPALPRVGRNLGRMYVEAMLPALLGYQDVVFDRCWLSEVPYGTVFREGHDRLTDASRRMLERLAFRCGAVVVMCLPPFEVVKTNYMRRRHLKMLDNADQLAGVHYIYESQVTALPVVSHDYRLTPVALLPEIVGEMRTGLHFKHLASAGNGDAKVVLVGDCFAERKDCDSWYQWPFASFSNSGCSQWLTNLLEYHGIGEGKLFWVNADQDLTKLDPHAHYIALGPTVAGKLMELQILHQTVEHPQLWKKFRSGKLYPLITKIKESL